MPGPRLTALPLPPTAKAAALIEALADGALRLAAARWPQILVGGPEDDELTASFDPRQDGGRPEGRFLLVGGGGDDRLGVSVRDADSAIALRGGTGNDLLSTSIIAREHAQAVGIIHADGGAGDDVIRNTAVVGPASEALSFYRFAGGSGNDEITSSTRFFGAAAAGGFSHAESLSGGSGDDLLSVAVGPFGERTALGDIGLVQLSLTLDGGAGADVMRAGASLGTDPDSSLRVRMAGGTGDDVAELVYSGQGAKDILLTGGAGDDLLTLDNRMTVVGDVFNRIPSPGGGRVEGGAGDDTLGGWGGEIIATGGEGVDTFIFDPAAMGRMHITDLDAATERIRFSIRDDRSSIFDDPAERWEDAAITGIEDTGPGGDVIVRFASGAVLVIEGHGTGGTDDIGAFLEQPWGPLG